MIGLVSFVSEISGAHVLSIFLAMLPPDQPPKTGMTSNHSTAMDSAMAAATRGEEVEIRSGSIQTFAFSKRSESAGEAAMAFTH